MSDMLSEMDGYVKLKKERDELAEMLRVTIYYLEDDLWVSGEARQAQRERARELLERIKGEA